MVPKQYENSIINQHQNQTISKANKKQHTIGVYTTGVHVKRHRERKRETKSLLRRSALHCKGEIDQESISRETVLIIANTNQKKRKRKRNV